jgi:hypothetical protein
MASSRMVPPQFVLRPWKTQLQPTYARTGAQPKDNVLVGATFRDLLVPFRALVHSAGRG